MMNSGQPQQGQPQPPQGQGQGNPLQQIMQVVSMLAKRIEAIEAKMGGGEQQEPQPQQPSSQPYASKMP